MPRLRGKLDHKRFWEGHGFSRGARSRKKNDGFSALGLTTGSVRRLVFAGLAAGSAVHEAVGAQTHVELGLAEHAKFFASATRFRPLALGADDSAYARFRRHDLEFSGVEVGKEHNGSHRRAGLGKRNACFQ